MHDKAHALYTLAGHRYDKAVDFNCFAHRGALHCFLLSCARKGKIREAGRAAGCRPLLAHAKEKDYSGYGQNAVFIRSSFMV
jgi:hypothetical protein